MSRSNPSDSISNPCTRWFEWDGENGQVRYYDKEAKKNVIVGDDFTYMVLDILSVIKGFHESSQSNIISNEVRDTRAEPFVVRSFKGGVLAQGLYADIKERVTSKKIGGHFTVNCYIAYRAGNDIKLGSIQFKGAALGAWMEFRKANRKGINEKAVRINGFTQDKKGTIVFRMPKFHIVEISETSNEQAILLDREELQPYLKAYLGRSQQPVSSLVQEAEAEQEEEEDNINYDPEDAFTRGRDKLTAERKAFEAEEAKNKASGYMPPANDEESFASENIPF